MYIKIQLMYSNKIHQSLINEIKQIKVRDLCRCCPVSVATLSRTISSISLCYGGWEAIVLGYSVQLLRAVSPVMTMRRRATASVPTCIRHAGVSRRPILIWRTVTSTLDHRSPLKLQKKSFEVELFFFFLDCDNFLFFWKLFVPEVLATRGGWDDDAASDEDDEASGLAPRYPCLSLLPCEPYCELLSWPLYPANPCCTTNNKADLFHRFHWACQSWNLFHRYEWFCKPIIDGEY